MEHISLQQDMDVSKVPFVAESREFGIDDFFRYPETRAWNSRNAAGQLRLLNLNETQQFLQSWLFFSLLSQVLGERIHPEMFTRIDDETEIVVITTEDLPSHIDRWKEREEDDSIPFDKKRLRQIRREIALDEASKFVSTWSSDIHKIHSGLDPSLFLSFALLGETLSRANQRIRSSSKSYTGESWENRSQLNWGRNKYLTTQMQRNGWCPFLIRMLESSISQVTGLYYTNSFKPPQAEDHSLCSSQRCIAAANVDLSTYKTVHRKPDCTCAHLAVDSSKLHTVVKRGNIPVMLYTRSGQLEVHEYCISTNAEAIPSDTSERPVPRAHYYGTLSHVWADGLGNTEGNSLPRCQLSSLQNMFNNAGSHKHGDIPFWIDTLCVPQTANPAEVSVRELRDQAMGVLRSVYEESILTIVLDRSLYSEAMPRSALEPAIRINISQWARRLWTLQEGALCSQLFFKFSDRMIRSDELQSRYDKAEETLYNSVALAGKIFYQSMRGLRTAEGENRVARLWESSQWRSASRPDDEPICLATLLEIDTTDLGGVTGEMKMAAFYKMLDYTTGIPAGLIFVPGPKLDLHGYGWAPRSWMTAQTQDNPKPLNKTAQPSYLTHHGLLVQYPGIRLNLASTQLQPTFVVPVSKRLDRWYRLTCVKEEQNPDWEELFNNRQSQYAVIFSQPEPQSEPEIAILVSIKRQRDGAIWGDFLCRLFIQLEDDFSSISKLGDDFRNNPDHVIWGEMLESQQRWCIDRRIETR